MSQDDHRDRCQEFHPSLPIPAVPGVSDTRWKSGMCTLVPAGCDDPKALPAAPSFYPRQLQKQQPLSSQGNAARDPQENCWRMGNKSHHSQRCLQGQEMEKEEEEGGELMV